MLEFSLLSKSISILLETREIIPKSLQFSPNSLSFSQSAGTWAMGRRYPLVGKEVRFVPALSGRAENNKPRHSLLSCQWSRRLHLTRWGNWGRGEGRACLQFRVISFIPEVTHRLTAAVSYPDDRQRGPAKHERSPSSFPPPDSRAENRSPFLARLQAGALGGPRHERRSSPGVHSCRPPVLQGGEAATYLRLERTQFLAWRRPYSLRHRTAKRDGCRGPSLR